MGKYSESTSEWHEVNWLRGCFDLVKYQRFIFLCSDDQLNAVHSIPGTTMQVQYSVYDTELI